LPKSSLGLFSVEVDVFQLLDTSLDGEPTLLVDDEDVLETGDITGLELDEEEFILIPLRAESSE
jgi:hypothetical protein